MSVQDSYMNTQPIVDMLYNFVTQQLVPAEENRMTPRGRTVSQLVVPQNSPKASEDETN